MKREESFFSRWSRLKKAAKSMTQVKPANVPAAGASPVELPPIETLDLSSDFSCFLHPEVDSALRNQALKKLFHDPHFNAMDGLDVYVGDYTVSEPIPAAMLQQLLQAQTAPREEEAVEQPAIQVVEAENPTDTSLTEAPALEEEVRNVPELEGQPDLRSQVKNDA